MKRPESFREKHQAASAKINRISIINSTGRRDTVNKNHRKGGFLVLMEILNIIGKQAC